MAFDAHQADRIRAALAERVDVVERKMFGGVAFMVAGNMALGLIGDELMVRVGAERYEEALARRHVRLMDFTGRPLVGFVYVAAAGFRTRAALQAWVDEAAAYAASRPPSKKPKRKPRRPPKVSALR